MNNLLLLRHSQSKWNKERRFTGWADVDLAASITASAREAIRSAAFKVMEL